MNEDARTTELRAQLAAQDAELRASRQKVEAYQSQLAASEQVLEVARGELERMRIALQVQNAAKDRFLSQLNHELRNPLGALSSAVEVLKDPRSDAVEERMRAIVARQVRQLAALCDELHDFTQIQSGRLELRRAPFDLATLVTSTASSRRADAEAQNVALHCEVGAQIWVDGDRTRLQQVLDHLLRNALRSTDAGAEISVLAQPSPSGKEVLVRIRDTGCGIAPEQLHEVFQPFFRGAAKGSCGLGLALARMILQMHGGDLAAASEGPGKGSEFTARLTRVPPPGQGGTPN